MTMVSKVILMAAVMSLVAGQTGKELCILEGGNSYELFISDVYENAKNGSVLTVVPIVGNETEVRLEAKDHPFFGFNTSSREVFLHAELDTDVGAPEITNLEIQCTETMGSDMRPITISVGVLVTDWNDNPPVFKETEMKTLVSEDAKIGDTIFTQVSATDNDKAFSGNSRVTYSIVQGTNYSDYFQIPVPSKPNIVLAKQLDYESITMMTVQIRAVDSPRTPMPQLSATATLTVSVEDADDQNPVFTRKSYSGSISVISPVGTAVDVKHKIHAYDPDTMNATIEYELWDTYDIFAIHPTTAEVYTIERFYVNIPTITVVVIAYQTDNPSREWFAMLTVSISQANVNAPIFSQQIYVVTKLELEPVGSTLVTTTATDPDFGTFIYYTIKEPVTDMVINDEGRIILTKSLDYEKEQYRTIHVTASDGIYTATATVEITIVDVNDNNPVIHTEGTEFFRERENGLLITKINATDADINSTLTFQLGNHQSLFTINEDGEIFISSQPETLVADQYHLLVTVHDNGTPSRMDATQIAVIFPKDSITTSPTVTVGVPVEKEEPNIIMMIILGAVAGVLLVVIVLLVVYIVWRNNRVKEELSKARAPREHGPHGLTYRPAESPDDLPRMDLHFGDDVDAISQYDGDTTVQRNPLSDAAVNQGYLQSSGSEMDRDVSEIEVETAVIPYDDDNGYSSASSKYTNGHMRTFHGDDTTSSGSSQSDSTHGSRRVLVNEKNKEGTGKMTSWDSDDRIHPQGSEKLLDPNTAVTPVKTKKEKPEITVYF